MNKSKVENGEVIEKMKLQDMANKYHVGDMMDKPFFKDMITQWMEIKKVTGKDPHEWMKHFDAGTYKNTGAIGWIDAQRAIEAVAKGFQDALNQQRSQIIKEVKEYKKQLEQEKQNLLDAGIEDTSNVNHAIGAVRNVLTKLEK